jgi:polysaccharide deacetylase 2 family uncharacterized protein YibQ
LKKSQREIINIIALVIILIVAFNISNLFNNSIKEEDNLRNTQDVNPATTNEIELEVKESEETTYDSEQYTDLIVDDLTSSEEETNFSPKAAFIIDDLGYETEVAKKIMELEFPIALSILPFLQYSEFMQAVRKCILDFPYAIGVNNHMGSKITEDREIMEIVLEEIKGYNLFFIDSITTKDSIAYEVAQEMEIKSAVRSVFLDNENDMEYIKGQMLEVREAALREGEVIAIGHSRINTFYVLKVMIPELIRAGIEIVPVSELVK